MPVVHGTAQIVPVQQCPAQTMMTAERICARILDALPARSASVLFLAYHRLIAAPVLSRLVPANTMTRAAAPLAINHTVTAVRAGQIMTAAARGAAAQVPVGTTAQAILIHSTVPTPAMLTRTQRLRARGRSVPAARGQR